MTFIKQKLLSKNEENEIAKKVLESFEWPSEQLQGLAKKRLLSATVPKHNIGYIYKYSQKNNNWSRDQRLIIDYNSIIYF